MRNSKRSEVRKTEGLIVALPTVPQQTNPLRGFATTLRRAGLRPNEGRAGGVNPPVAQPGGHTSRSLGHTPPPRLNNVVAGSPLRWRPFEGAWRLAERSPYTG